MAMQAQHGASDLRPLPNQSVLARFGDVENQPMSGLTCNASASTKRSRNNFEAEFSQQYEALPDLFIMQHRSRVCGSVSTSTSGRTSAAHTVGGLDLSSQLYQQGLEIEALVSFQVERMRNEMELVSKRYCLDLQSALVQRIQDKEAELARASRRHAELEQKARQIAAENQFWFNVAKTYESLVRDLSCTLEQTLLQNTAKYAPGSESGDCVEEMCALILPCRHLCHCMDCESSFDTCPICHTIKNASIQILLS